MPRRLIPEPYIETVRCRAGRGGDAKQNKYCPKHNIENPAAMQKKGGIPVHENMEEMAQAHSVHRVCGSDVRRNAAGYGVCGGA